MLPDLWIHTGGTGENQFWKTDSHYVFTYILSIICFLFVGIKYISSISFNPVHILTSLLQNQISLSFCCFLLMSLHKTLCSIILYSAVSNPLFDTSTCFTAIFFFSVGFVFQFLLFIPYNIFFSHLNNYVLIYTHFSYIVTIYSIFDN